MGNASTVSAHSDKMHARQARRNALLSGMQWAEERESERDSVGGRATTGKKKRSRGGGRRGGGADERDVFDLILLFFV